MWGKRKTQPEMRNGSQPNENRTAKKSPPLHYYEQDGALRAYANRAMVVSFISAITAFLAIAFAAYVRLQPPLVFRVDANGEASVVGRKPLLSAAAMSVARGVDAEPNDFDKKAFMRMFLERYLDFSADTVSHNWADALNMMTSNLRRATLDMMQKDNTVGRVQDEQITSIFHLRSIEGVKDDPLSFTAYGTKEVHRVSDHHESLTSMVGKYHIRLILERRTEENPSGLLIAEYGEELLEDEKRDAAAQDATFSTAK